MTLRSTLPGSGPPPSSLRLWWARIAPMLSSALIPAEGLPSAQAEPLDKTQPGLLNVSDARRIVGPMNVDREGGTGGYNREKFYTSRRMVTAIDDTSTGVRKRYGWDAYAWSTRRNEPDVASALKPRKGCDEPSSATRWPRSYTVTIRSSYRHCNSLEREAPLNPAKRRGLY